MWFENWRLACGPQKRFAMIDRLKRERRKVLGVYRFLGPCRFASGDPVRMSDRRVPLAMETSDPIRKAPQSTATQWEQVREFRF
jgi:hypothetical protein